MGTCAARRRARDPSAVRRPGATPTRDRRERRGRRDDKGAHRGANVPRRAHPCAAGGSKRQLSKRTACWSFGRTTYPSSSSGRCAPDVRVYTSEMMMMGWISSLVYEIITTSGHPQDRLLSCPPPPALPFVDRALVAHNLLLALSLPSFPTSPRRTSHSPPPSPASPASSLGGSTFGSHRYRAMSSSVAPTLRRYTSSMS